MKSEFRQWQFRNTNISVGQQCPCVSYRSPWGNISFFQRKWKKNLKEGGFYSFYNKNWSRFTTLGWITMKTFALLKPSEQIENSHSELILWSFLLSFLQDKLLLASLLLRNNIHMMQMFLSFSQRNQRKTLRF